MYYFYINFSLKCHAVEKTPKTYISLYHNYSDLKAKAVLGFTISVNNRSGSLTQISSGMNSILFLYIFTPCGRLQIGTL